MRALALGFLIGTFLLQRSAALPAEAYPAAALVPLLAVGLVPLGRGGLRAALFLAAGLAAGHQLAADRALARLSASLPVSLEGTDLVLEGIVASLPQRLEASTRFTFEVVSGAAPATISLAWYAEGDVPPPVLVAGDRLALVARLKRPRGLLNPHAFDFEPWALARGIRATGYVRMKPDPPRFAGRVEGWPYSLHRWRGEVRDAMRAHLGASRFTGVLVALAIGDQDAIAPADWDVFWRTGVGHLMSISGLHITMLAGIGFAIAHALWVRVPALALRWPARKAASVAGVAVALAYTLMTGYAVPAQRTVAMLAALAAAVVLDRSTSASRVLAAAALAVLLLDPWAVLAPGFWLSFGAVAAILYAVALRTGERGALRRAFSEQAAVTVAMLPMLAALFQEVSRVSPLANAFAIPAVSLVVVPLDLVGAFLGLPVFLDAAHAVMEVVMVPLEALAAGPGAMLEAPEPPAWAVAVGLAGCAWLLAPRGVPMRTCGAILLAPLVAIPPPRPPPGEAWVDVLDVGNGLAIAVRTARHALQYDAGPSWSAESDSGARIVVPFLRGEGIPVLDALVVSHADDDHAGGAASVARLRQPGWLLTSIAPGDDMHPGIEPAWRCESGQRWDWDGVRFEVLHPPAAFLDDPGTRDNDRSCVLRVAAAGGSALLAGDVEARGEAAMVAAHGAKLRTDILLVPHHGSKTSSTPPFLDAVSPAAAIFSVGYRNRFRHPNPAVWSRYAVRGIASHRTDREGALRIIVPERGPARIEALASTPRYWRDTSTR